MQSPPSGIVFLDSTVVNVALPRIGRDLPRLFLGVLEGQSYVYNAYLLTLSALLILAGALSDFYGRRKTFLLGLIGFGATSVLCGLAPNMELLVLFRVLQGAAGALLVPGSLALITANFSGVEQGRAFGVWAGASGATTILGPVVGGLLVDTVSWRAAFLINVPLVLLAAWATWKHVPESRDDQASSQFDWWGSVLVGLAVGGLAFGTIYGQQRDWATQSATHRVAVGVLATVGLPFYMMRKTHPLIRSSAVPCPQLHRHQPVDPFDLRRALRHLLLPRAVPAGHDRLYRCGGGAGRHPRPRCSSSSSPRASQPGGQVRPRWFMAVGPLLMAVGVLWFARILRKHALAAAAGCARLLPSALFLRHRLPAGFDPLRAGNHDPRGAADHGAHDLRPCAQLGVASAINAISRVGPQLAGALIFVFLTANFYGYLAARLSVNVNDPSFRARVSPLNMPLDPQIVGVVRDASTSSFHIAMVWALPCWSSAR
jgi:hypothetical protein